MTKRTTQSSHSRGLLELLLTCGFIVALGYPGYAIAQQGEPDSVGDAAGVECVSYVPPEEREDVGKLTLRGVACFEKARYLQALRFYRQAYGQARSPILMAAIGRSFQELGYPAIARSYYKKYLVANSGEGPGTEKIRQRLATVEKRLQKEGVPVRIETSPPGSRVAIVIHGEYREDLGRAPLQMSLVPGQYQLVFEGEGYLTRTETVDVEPDTEERRVDVELVDESAAFAITSRRWQRIGVYFMMASIPFAAASGSLWWMSMEREEDAAASSDPVERRELRNDASSLEDWAIISTAVGGASLLTGLMFYVTGVTSVPDEASPDSSPSPTVAGKETAASLSPVVGPGSIGLRLIW